MKKNNPDKNTFRMNKQFEDAARMFERSIELNPDKSAVHYQLGMVYRQMGRTEEAVREIQLSNELRRHDE